MRRTGSVARQLVLAKTAFNCEARVVAALVFSRSD